MKRLLTLIFLLGTVLSVSATSVYLTKSQAGNDAVSAYRYAHSHEGDPKWQGILDIYADSVMVPNGESIALTDTLTYAGSLPGREGDGFSQYIIGANYAPGSTRFIIADWQGQSLAFDVHDLQFSEEKSDKGAKNYLYQFEDHRSLNQRFWDTMIPCTIIFILLILSVLCIAVADWLDVPEFSKIMLIVSGVLTLIVAIFELEGFFTVHDNIFWWISISKVGFWKALLGLIPLLLAALMQFGGVWYFSKVMTSQFGSEDKPVSVVPLLKTMGYTLGGMFLFEIINSMTLHWHWLNTVVEIGALVFILYYIYRSMNEWRGALGQVMGLVFTAYAVVWAFSSVIAVLFYVIGFLQVIVPLIATAIVACGVWLMIKHFATANYDLNGKMHKSASERDEANRKIMDDRRRRENQ